MGVESTRRNFVKLATMAAAAPVAMLSESRLLAEESTADDPAATAFDVATMKSLAAFTAKSFDTPSPVPYGAVIVKTATGEELMRAINHVGPLHDPSAHGEVYTIRLACAKLGTASLRGYTLYTTCEPCPMCMACCLWAGLDRVVYGATIDDAAKFGQQIHVYAKAMLKTTNTKCVVTGPVVHATCYALFTDPRMQAAMARWKKG